MKTVVMDLQYALMSTALVQPVDVKAKGGRVEFLLRLVPGQEKPWLGIMDKLLAIPLPGEMHLCRRYMRKDGVMVFGYCLILDMGSAKLLKSVMGKVIDVLKDARPVLRAVAAPVVSSPPAVATDSPRPSKKAPEIRVVERRVDDDGNEVIVEEMSLPHVNTVDMNRPSHKGGRGATKTATGAR